MDIVINGKEVSVSTDSRFSAWCKVLTADKIDLSEEGGYRIKSEFEKISDVDVEIDDCEYVLFAAQTGSRAHHYYSYCLFNRKGEDIGYSYKSRLRKLKKIIPDLYSKDENNGCKTEAGAAALFVVCMSRLAKYPDRLPLLINSDDYEISRIVNYHLKSA